MASNFGRRGAAALILLAAVLLAGCTVPPDDLPPIPDPPITVYRLGPGDQVRLITAGEETVTGQFRVDVDGTVAVPLLGPIKAAGLTASELGRAVAAGLRATRDYKDPSVSVEVSAYRPLAVLGEVNKPGQYPYQPNMTVADAIADAGGFTYRAIDDRVAIARTDGGGTLRGRALLATRVHPGDVVTAYERPF